MPKSKTAKHSKRLPTTRRRRTFISVALMLCLFAAGGALAHWSGIVSLERKQNKKSSGPMTPQSYEPGSPSKEYIYSGGRLVATEEPGSTCSYSIDPPSQSFSASGGTGSVAVTAGADCTWSAGNNPAWITINSGSSGSGDGTINYTVEPNGGTARNGTITVTGNQTFTVTQSGAGGGCSGAGTGAGLTGQYFNNMTMTGTPVLTRGDPSVEFTWGAGSPDPSIQADHFSARWTGKVQPQCSEAYTFYVFSDDGVRVWVNDQLLIDKWFDQYGPEWSSAPISLTGGQQYDIKVEFYENALGAEIHLKWSSVSTPKQTIPQAQLYPVGCNYSLLPPSASYTASGGSGSVTVTAGAGCNWSAISNDLWITINSGGSGTGNGIVSYSVTANLGGVRNGTMTIAGQTFPVSQSAAAGCTYSVSPTNQNFIAAGGTGSISVTAGTGCNWTATSTGWIIINSGSPGSGNGSVGYSVAPNTGQQRSGTITIATQTVTITQDSGCAFTISPPSANYTTSGGSGSVAVTANDQTCPWTAISNNQTWITVTSGASGTGNGTVGYSVAANTGGLRSGSISIAAQSFSVTQDGVQVGCQVSTFAGTGTAGYGEGGGGFSKWSAPVGAVLGKSPITGNPDALFVADATNNRIRVVYLSSANSALIAGNGTAGYSEGSGNPLNPLNAMYNHPKGITAIKDVNGIVTALLVADTDNHVIRKLAWSGSAWTPSLYSGKQGTVGYVDGTAGNSRYNQPQAISAASSSLIFVADTGNGKIRKLDQNGASTTQSATGVTSPTGVTVNLTTTNLIYVSDQAQHKIFQVNTTTSVVTLLAGNGSPGFADGIGTAAQFNSPRQLVWTSGDVLFMADVNNFRVRKLVAGTQIVTTLAGSGAQGNADGACASASFKGPQGIAAFGPAGEVYVVDTADNKIRKVQP